MNRSLTSHPVSWVLFLSLTIVIYLSCAEVGAPPGGEEDKTGPVLVGSVPANGDLNVPPSDEITLYFSEPLTEPNSRSVFISPRPTVEPKVKFKSNRIEIKLAEPFEPDRTYIVSLHSQITDRRRNKIDSLGQIAFSTGERIDNGMIYGTVLAEGSVPYEGKPAAGALVGLWELSRLNVSELIDSIYPNYLTTTDQLGQFKFEYLPVHEYRLAAFVDRNKDERLNPLREPVALPDRPIIVSDSEPLENLMMRLYSEDTSEVSILSAAYSPDRLVRLRLSRAVKIAWGDRKPTLKSEATGSELSALALREDPNDKPTQLNLYFGPVPEGSYDLVLPLEGSNPELTYPSLLVKATEDKTKPKIERQTPGDRPVFLDEAQISFLFSEPIDTTKLSVNSLTLWNKEDQMIPLTIDWINPFKLDLEASLEPGGDYRLTLTEFDFVDMSENLLGDSLIDFYIRILDADSLGSVTGRVKAADSSRSDFPLLIELYKLENKQRYGQAIEDGRFMLDLPAGKYLMWGLIDADSNGVVTDGRWSPYQEGETIALYGDTIKVRARFETTGLDFKIK